MTSVVNTDLIGVVTSIGLVVSITANAFQFFKYRYEYNIKNQNELYREVFRTVEYIITHAANTRSINEYNSTLLDKIRERQRGGLDCLELLESLKEHDLKFDHSLTMLQVYAERYGFDVSQFLKTINDYTLTFNPELQGTITFDKESAEGFAQMLSEKAQRLVREAADLISRLETTFDIRTRYRGKGRSWFWKIIGNERK